MDAIYIVVIAAVALALLIPVGGMAKTLLEMAGFELDGWRIRKRPDGR